MGNGKVHGQFADNPSHLAGKSKEAVDFFILCKESGRVIEWVIEGVMWK